MSPRLTVFCGKGGVGKTCLSLAFGLLQAGRGVRVLVVTSHPVRELALSISLAGLKEVYPGVADNLLIVHIDPKQVVARTVGEQIPSRLLAQRILSSKVYQNIVEIAPGIKELAFLGRLRELTEEDLAEGGGYGCVIWDAPATGHFLETLKATRKLETYLTGPLASRGRELAKFYSDATLDLYPVTSLEEMAVEETIELCSGMRSDLDLHPDAVLCNMVSPLAMASEEEVNEVARSVETLPASGLTFVMETHNREKRHLERLREMVRAPFLMVERVCDFQSDLELLSRVSEQLFEAGLGAE